MIQSLKYVEKTNCGFVYQINQVLPIFSGCESVQLMFLDFAFPICIM